MQQMTVASIMNSVSSFNSDLSQIIAQYASHTCTKTKWIKSFNMYAHLLKSVRNDVDNLIIKTDLVMKRFNILQ